MSVAQGIFNPSFVNIVDGEQENERHHILELSQLDDAESAEVLLGYTWEALRE